MTQQQPILIGLTGLAGAGKSTVAHHLMDEWSFEHLAFADPIVSMVSALFDEANVPAGYITERLLKEEPTPLGPSYRRLAQTLGTEWGRELVHPDLWVRVTAAKVQAARDLGCPVVISDCRFPNEAEWIKSAGGWLLRIERPGLRPVAAHISEQHVVALPADMVLHNSDSLLHLTDQVDAFIKNLRSAA